MTPKAIMTGVRILEVDNVGGKVIFPQNPIADTLNNRIAKL